MAPERGTVDELDGLDALEGAGERMVAPTRCAREI